MGCCQSNAAHDEVGNDQPAQGIVQSHGSHQAPGPSPAARARNNNGANRPNQRIREPSPVPRSPRNVSNRPPPWTRSHLVQERLAFFETRVTGRPEVWAALKRVCEFLREADLENAQAILDAASINCPSGKVARARGSNRRGGVYDERGDLYDIPNWVLTDPQDIVEDAEDKIGAEDSDDAQEDEQTVRRREEKGKGKAIDPGEEMKVRVRFSDGTPDLEITFGAKQNAGVVVTKIWEERAQRATLLHLGKKIDEKQTLEKQGWAPGVVLNAFLHLKEETSSSLARDAFT